MRRSLLLLLSAAFMMSCPKAKDEAAPAPPASAKPETTAARKEAMPPGPGKAVDGVGFVPAWGREMGSKTKCATSSDASAKLKKLSSGDRARARGEGRRSAGVGVARESEGRRRPEVDPIRCAFRSRGRGINRRSRRTAQGTRARRRCSEAPA